MDTGKAILGIVAGLATGAVLGILFAPDKGSETRRKMIKKGEDLGSALNKRMEETLLEYEQKVEEALRQAVGKVTGVKNDKTRERAEMN
jgi:gas vesicle protein